MFMRYVLVIAALVEDEIKTEVFIVNKEPSDQEMKVMTNVRFPDATKTRWSLNLLEIEHKENFN